MNIRIDSDFPFSVAAIQYAPDGELRMLRQYCRVEPRAEKYAE